MSEAPGTTHASRGESESEEFVRKTGLKFTLIGLSIGMAPIMYAAVVLVMVFTNSPGRVSSGEAEDPAYILPVAAVLLLLSALTASAAFFVRRRILQRELPLGLETLLLDGARCRTREFTVKLPDDSDLPRKAARYFLAALVGSALMELPAVCALVLALVCLFGEFPLLTLTPVSILILIMLFITLLGNFYVLPSTGGLRRYLRGDSNERAGAAAPLNTF